VAVVATIGVLPGMSGEVESSMTVTRCRRMNGRLSTTDRRRVGPRRSPRRQR
jgi:hypothetical protein